MFARNFAEKLPENLDFNIEQFQIKITSPGVF